MKYYNCTCRLFFPKGGPKLSIILKEGFIGKKSKSHCSQSKIFSREENVVQSSTHISDRDWKEDFLRMLWKIALFSLDGYCDG